MADDVQTVKNRIKTLLDNDMNVTETIAVIIANWPSLHTSRLCALRNIFTGDCDDWSKGYPHPARMSAIYTSDDFEAEAKDYEKTMEGRKQSVTDALRHAKDRADKRFIRENAALIAFADYGEWYDFRYVPTFSTYQLNSISPETLNETWKKALIEFCKAILVFPEERARRNPNGYTTETIERKVSDLNEAKATAREALNRLGIADENAKRERDRAIEKLRHEAQKLGFKLEKVDPKNVFA